MTEETTWIEFEAYCGTVGICGYMALDEADDEAPLQFYGADGLECGTHISNTRMPHCTETYLQEWETLVEWFTVTDVVQYLVDFAEEAKIIRRVFKGHGIVLYINCSPFGLDTIDKVDKSTTIRVNQSTKNILDQIGNKGQTYDDIINELIRRSGYL